MFAFVKNLFSKRPAPRPVRPVDPAAYTSLRTAPVPSTVEPAAPTVNGSHPRKPEAASHNAHPLKSQVQVGQGTPAAASPVSEKPIFSKETVDVPLKLIWPKLKSEVTKLAVAEPAGDSMLRLPLNIVQAQLARGGMRLPLTHLRLFSPAGLFPESCDKNSEEVAIPISEILPRLKPDQLPRRAGQRKVEVPADIDPVFGPDAVKNSVQLAAAKAKSPAPEVPKQEAAHAALVVEPLPKPAPVAPSAPLVASPITPAPAEVPPPSPMVPVAARPLPPVPSKTPLPTPAPSAPAPVPTSPPPAGNTEPIRAPKLDPALARLSSPRMAEKVISIALMDIADFWGQRGQTELEKLYRHSIEIPAPVLETALKKGKVEFSWREVRPWIRLASGNSLPVIDEDARIEFPLSVVAPRFLEVQHRSAGKKRMEPGTEIPDIFVRSAPASHEPAELAPPVDSLAAAQPDDFGDIFGQPEKKDWSVGEVSQRAATLPGVAGAIVATPDGLLVGGSWPEGVGTEAVAAFAPQIYSRMASYTRELKLGDPGHFTLMVENVPLQIFKSANSYFTVLGRAGEKLPARELNAIATRLAASANAN